jgi:CRISPR-associated endonuclease/helicase Cas3
MDPTPPTEPHHANSRSSESPCVPSPTLSLDQVLSFWGKARAGDGATVPCHPVLYHLLDVAATTRALLETRPASRARAAWLLGLDEDEALRLIVVLVALHDLGKFCPAFQGKAPPHWPPLLGPYDPGCLVGTRHTDDGYVLWSSHLAERLGPRLWRGGAEALDSLARSVFGHHGRPVAASALREKRAEWRYRGESLPAALACADAVVSLLLPEPIDARAPAAQRVRLASWWVAGLVTIADWIGSREQWFRYKAPDAIAGGLAGYWAYALDRALEAVRAEGLAAPAPAALRTFRELTGITAPSPAQAWAETVALPDGPLLVLLEDVTGAGKTEAAQMLVHRLVASRRASGAFWAMPTQATANAMYARQERAIGALFDGAATHRPSIVLAHGQARLHERFRATVLPRAEDEREESTGDDADELTSTVACAAFFAEDRRAALLADVGAGTVDQALLGVLASKFNTVRLFGLAEKVLVLDEAHAYDAYMNVELRQLLRFHAALGGSAVVLSATLSQAQRAELAVAWMQGVDGGRRRPPPLFGAGPAPVPPVRSTAYPLATIVADDATVARETPLDAAPWSRRTVAVRFVRTAGEALERVLDAATQGGAVAWIRNTVDDCLAGAAALRERGVTPLVFHARLAQGDRQRREAEVVRRFGAEASSEERRGRVLVATQVIEQSLDLDFDAMVSDLAPVDLLIQRAGRLQRHPERDATRPQDFRREHRGGRRGELVVLAPPTDAEPARDWLTALLPGTAHVYQHTGVLWRTALVLARAKAIETPDGLRGLIEAVYASDDVPEALVRATDLAEGRDHAAAATAQHSVLDVAEGYHGDAHGWVDELRAMTRLSDAPTTTIRLARSAPDGTLSPWEGEAIPWQRWALSEIRVRASRVPLGAVATPEVQAAVDAIRAGWGRFEREIPVLPLVETEPGVWRGRLIHPQRDRVLGFTYTSGEGLVYERRSG